MRVVFMGTPPIAATILESLAEKHEIVSVYSRPDAVRKRGNGLVASPVKQLAEHLGIPVRTPRTLRDPDEVAHLDALAPDVICVAAYGALLPESVLSIPRHGCLNVHASALPRWRGAAPIERAILAGDERAGVCVMRMETGLDTGDFACMREVEIGSSNAGDLTARLARCGAEALIEALDLADRSELSWTAQDEAAVTYADKIGKGELDPRPDDSAEDVERKVRASSEAHPSHSVIANRDTILESVRILAESDEDLAEGLEPGQARFSRKRFVLKCSEGAVEVLGLRPRGKKSMDARSFAAGIQNVKNIVMEWGTE